MELPVTDDDADDAASAPTDDVASAPTDDDVLPDRSERQPSTVRQVVEWVLLLGGALVLALLIKTFLFQAFYIPSSSMVPTLDVHDRVLVNKLSYHFHDVHRGDIVVFRAPPGETEANIKDLVKRVVGLPGDTVQGRDGHVYIDGHLLAEPYLPANVRTSSFGPIDVPADSYFMMGDNRPDSRDSRYFGTIKRSSIIGRAFVRIWPLSRLGFL